MQIRMNYIKKVQMLKTYNLVRKEIHGRCETNNPTEEQTGKYKRHKLQWVKDDKYMYAQERIITAKINETQV